MNHLLCTFTKIPTITEAIGYEPQINWVLME
jgi:hypothetical protein